MNVNHRGIKPKSKKIKYNKTWKRSCASIHEKVCHKDIKMDEITKLCVFTLKLIDEANMDLSIGGKPPIWGIPDFRRQNR